MLRQTARHRPQDPEYAVEDTTVVQTPRGLFGILRLTPERMGHQDRRAPDSRGADRYARRKAAFFEVLAGGAAGIAAAFLARRNALSLAVLR
jgi:hypothetical protein